jgi:hypothetical protein
MIRLSLGSQPSAVNSLAKHFSRTLIAMKAAVEAPGEAPRSATSERSAAATSAVPSSSRRPRLTAGLMVSTRCPATCSRQSSDLASGK